MARRWSIPVADCEGVLSDGIEQLEGFLMSCGLKTRRWVTARFIAVMPVVMMFGLASFPVAGDAVPKTPELLFRVVMFEDQQGDPAACGQRAARALKEAFGSVPLKAVIVSECFEDRENKEKLLAGLRSELPAQRIFGGATYGSFTHEGCTDFDAVCLLGIGGAQLSLSAALVTDMGTAKLSYDEQADLVRRRLHAAGRKLAEQLERTDRDRLLILVADAHSPKNQHLVEGVQQVFGKSFPITGGCVNKNAGQSFVYYGGKMYADSAVALLLGGPFQVALAGRQANRQAAVIETARQAAAEACKAARGQPLAVLAFNCAGRRGKLDRYEDELEAMQQVIRDNWPLFGCYCAGEIGPIDDPTWQSDARCGGSGWHVMFTVISR